MILGIQNIYKERYAKRFWVYFISFGFSFRRRWDLPGLKRLVEESPAHQTQPWQPRLDRSGFWTDLYPIENGTGSASSSDLQLGAQFGFSSVVPSSSKSICNSLKDFTFIGKLRSSPIPAMAEVILRNPPLFVCMFVCFSLGVNDSSWLEESKLWFIWIVIWEDRLMGNGFVASCNLLMWLCSIRWRQIETSSSSYWGDNSLEMDAPILDSAGSFKRFPFEFL